MCIAKIEDELLPIYEQLRHDEKPGGSPDGAEKCQVYRILMRRTFRILAENGFDFK